MSIEDPLLDLSFGHIWLANRVISGLLDLNNIPQNLRESVFAQIKPFYENVGLNQLLVQSMPAHLQESIGHLKATHPELLPKQSAKGGKKPAYRRGGKK
ncbi:MAG: hypothetical protein LBL30_02530 [Holosporales bacterium]|nr:hypothetical protein [Holosporales bacterium]